MQKKTFEFKAINEGKDLMIEGWANKGIVDSANDLMKYDNVNMDRFEKNPMLFFNHDWNKAIGKVIDYKLSEAGLWVKAKLSKSTDPMVSYVRDLVQEGILKTFSIGFDVKSSKKDKDTGANVIDNWELHEISVVTLPCNIDSEFALAKSLKKLKPYLIVKGAQVAEYLSRFELSEEQWAKLEELSKLSREEIAKVFSGEMTPVPNDFLAAFAAVTNMSEEQRQELAKLAGEEKPAAKPNEDDMPPADMPPEEPNACDSDKPKKPEDKKDEAFDKCVEEKIPVLISEGMEREQAVAVAIKYCQEKGLCNTKQEPATEPTAPISAESELTNPILDLAKSQLAMLGSILMELKGIAAALTKATVTQVQESIEEEDEQMEEQSQSELAKVLAIKERLTKTLMEE